MVLLKRRDLLGLLMALMIFAMVCLTDAAECDRTQRKVKGRCEPCPRCKPGYGLTGDCGHGQGDGVRCAKCPSGFFNPPPGGSTCMTCTNCTSFRRQEAFKCRNIIDAECGECLDGFFERHSGLKLGANLLLPCTSCTQNPEHPQCHHTRPQVVAPVTIRLQANLQSEDGTSARSSSRPIALLAVILGTGCLLTLGLLTFFIFRHRRLLRRLRTGSQEDNHVHQDLGPEEGCTNHSGSFVDNTTVWQRKDPVPHRKEAAPHRHGASCMTPARQAATWCPGLTIRPDPKRKRNQQGLRPSSHEDLEAEVNDWSDTDHLLSRKRPKITVTGSGRGPCGPLSETGSLDSETEVKDTAMTLTLKSKCDTGTPLTSNNPSIKEQFVFLPDTEQNKGEESEGDGEDSEGEDEDDGPPIEQEEAMDFEDVEEDEREHLVKATPAGDANNNSNQGEDEDDLQQYGACALPARNRYPMDGGPMWPYVDFRDLTLSPKQTAPSGLGEFDLSIDLDRDLEDRTVSRGSSGNVSQASTVLIRGLSDSPPTVFVEDSTVLTALDSIGWNTDSMTTDNTMLTAIQPPQTTDNTTLTAVQSPPTHDQSQTNLCDDRLPTTTSQIPETLSSPRDTSTMTCNDVTHISGSGGAPYVGPPPRRLASLANTFTRSRGDLAQSAETETESIPRMLESLDEERYAQALRLARDRLVAELDFDMTERLAASLHPRPLVGDRNFRHLGAALGVPPEVLSGACAFDDLLAHLRRQRVALIVLLKAVRALGRMDVVYMLSVWVLENTNTPGATTYRIPHELHLNHLIVPETQGPLSAEEEYMERTIPVQETGDNLPDI